MKGSKRSMAVPDIRGVYTDKKGNKVTISHVFGDEWMAKDPLGQTYKTNYEGMVEFLEDHEYTRLVVLETKGEE